MSNPEQQLAEDIASYFDNLAGFIMYAFPWGEEGGALSKQDGMDTWQIEVANEISEKVKLGMNVNEAVQAAIRVAVSSGHGIGKSALVAWIIIWFVSTRPHPQVVVTANTQAQLTNKTWRELAKWHRLSLNKHWFQWTATKFYLKEHPETWYASAIPWSEKNSEAFAGTHEEHVLMIFDEASAVADCIWEVCEGAMTTPGAMWICFGNPTRNTGRFFDCFGEFSHRWITRHIDSRTAKMANRVQLDEWVHDYGEDSDFVRVRVRGVFPRAGSAQFISSEDVRDCVAYKAEGYGSQPLVFGCDVARFGYNNSVIVKRRGRKHLETKKWNGISTMDFAAHIAREIMNESPDAVFVDGAGVGGGVIDRLTELGFNVIEVQAAGSPEDGDRYFNKRMECWARMNDWIKAGADIIDDKELTKGLVSPEYFYTASNKLQLEKKEDMKKRGLESPDDADALALTFAERVLSFARKSTRKRARSWRVI